MSLKTLARTNGLTSVLSDLIEPWNEWFQDGFAGKALTLPRVNITEDKNSYNLTLAAPGLHKKDFKIDVDGNMLTISAQQEHNKEEKEESFTRREYNYSSFSRTFTLPEEVELDKINASYDGGVLKLMLPKTEKAIKSNHKLIAVN
jgi:HSP20 family protein